MDTRPSRRAVLLERVDDLLARRSHVEPRELPFAPRLGGRFFDDRLCREALLFLRAFEEAIDPIREIDEEFDRAASNGGIVLDEIAWALSDHLADVADARTAREVAATGLTLLAHRRLAEPAPAAARRSLDRPRGPPRDPGRGRVDRPPRSRRVAGATPVRRWTAFGAAFLAAAMLGVALCLPPAPVREFEAAVEALERAGEPVRLQACADALPSDPWERFWLTTHPVPTCPSCTGDPLCIELWEIRSLANALAVDVRTTTLDVLLAMGRSLGRKPLGAYLRVGAYVQRTACAIALRGLAEGGWPTGEDLRSWSESFRPSAGELDVETTLRNYRAAVLDLVGALRAGRLPLPEEALPWMVENLARTRDARICAEALVFLHAVDEALEIVARPFQEGDARLPEIDPEDTIFLDDLHWMVPDLCREVAEARTARELAAAALAVLAHHRESGRWPPDFETAPIDHRTGRPARLEVRGEDAWIVLPGVGEWRVRPR